MPHGNQREGPYGPPPIQRELPREMPPYDAPPQYWGPPPPPRYPAHAPQAPRHPPQRVPPPEYHHHRQHVAPPPPPPHHYSPHHHHYGGPWRDSPERHYYQRPPPPHHAAAQRRDMPPPPHRGGHEDHYGNRPYMPMEHEHYVQHSAPPPPPPRTPPIQFRPTPKTERQSLVTPPAPKKQQQQPTKASSSGGGKKKGDALSLLAKVSTAMADPDEEAEKQKEAEQAAAAAEEHRSPPRTANSPVTMWTPKPSPPSTRSRQITPTHEPSQHHRYFHQPYPRYAPPPQQYGYGGYRGADSPPAVISERGSFEDPDHRAFGSPSRPPHHEDNNPHYAPYTYVQQPRLEDKTVLRKKFSWKHYPELERFLIANRDEYLRHSALNYTAEQKQYNNWLTERLLEVAARHHYVFCPDDFNFVAVRDRIRCYYKSYVQTARKRGLPLVSTSAQQPKAQKPRVESSSSAMEVTE